MIGHACSFPRWRTSRCQECISLCFPTCRWNRGSWSGLSTFSRRPQCRDQVGWRCIYIPRLVYRSVLDGTACLRYHYAGCREAQVHVPGPSRNWPDLLRHRDDWYASRLLVSAMGCSDGLGIYYTGGSLNPARSLGPDVINRQFPGYHWIYWVGPLLGSLLASGFFALLKQLRYQTCNPGQDYNELEAQLQSGNLNRAKSPQGRKGHTRGLSDDTVTPEHELPPGSPQSRSVV